MPGTSPYSRIFFIEDHHPLTNSNGSESQYMPKTIKRCAWTSNDPLMIAYHDEEWGVPLHDDLKMFEFLVLEGMQAGLSWSTILHKRENFRKAFHGFDPVRIARYRQRDIDRLLSDAGIIRNRLKIQAAITNAHCFLELQKEFGTFDAYILSN